MSKVLGKDQKIKRQPKSAENKRKGHGKQGSTRTRSKSAMDSVAIEKLLLRSKDKDKQRPSKSQNSKTSINTKRSIAAKCKIQFKGDENSDQ